MKLFKFVFWGAFLGLGLFNSYFHVATHNYWWLLLDAFCLFVFTRNFAKATRELLPE